MKSLLLIISLCFCLSSVSQSGYRKDFDYYWETVRDNFGYFDTQKTDWNKVRTIYQRIADTISTHTGFISFLETVNNELYNGHISLNTNLPSSHRLIPTGSDVWINYRNGKFFISAVRKGFNADLCGLKQGMQVTAFNDLPIDSAIRPILPKSVAVMDKSVFEYAANLVLAGTHDTKRKITVVSNGLQQNYFPDTIANMTENNSGELISTGKLQYGMGYIRINNSLGDNQLINAFDSVLDALWDSKALILDLRETPSGGNSTVARAIMSRFIEKEMPYQKHNLPGEEKEFGVRRSWVELVSPRGRIFKKPLVVLVNRWTGSMGEGIAIGFDGMKRATILGDHMAGLLGAIYSFTLPETGIGFSIPVEKLFHINGSPRENFIPVLLESDPDKQMAGAIKFLIAKLDKRP